MGQDHWRFCDKCTTMFFDGSPNKGHCAAGGGHEAQGFMFDLPHDVPETPKAQSAWRFCQKCNSMFFDGRPDKGHCPAGGGHQAQGFMFVLPHDVQETAVAQAAWRFCQKCTSMFFDGRPDKGHCPAGGGHQAQGFMFVLPHGGFVSPDILNFDSGPVTSPLPLGGSAHLVIRRSGDFTFTSHAHDSGFDNINYALAAVLMSSSGIAFTFEKSGHVEGTSAGLPFGTPNRNDNFVQTGNNPMISREFDSIVSGSRFVAKLNGRDLLVGGVRQIIDDTITDAAKQLAKAGASAVIALIAA
jgi:hypothetical protein